MKSTEVPTIKVARSFVILVVGFSADFVRRCQALAAGTAATIVGVDAGTESAFAMQNLPLAVVMARDTIRSSPLGTIARELGIGLIPVSGEDVTDARLKELFEGALAAAAARARRSSQPL